MLCRSYYFKSQLLFIYFFVKLLLQQINFINRFFVNNIYYLLIIITHFNRYKTKTKNCKFLCPNFINILKFSDTFYFFLFTSLLFRYYQSIPISSFKKNAILTHKKPTLSFQHIILQHTIYQMFYTSVLYIKIIFPIH